MTNEIKIDNPSLEQLSSTQRTMGKKKQGNRFKYNKFVAHYVWGFKQEILKMTVEYSLAFRKIIGLTYCIYHQCFLNFSPVNWRRVQATHKEGNFWPQFKDSNSPWKYWSRSRSCICIYYENLLKSKRPKQHSQIQSLISITSEGSSKMNKTHIQNNSMMRLFHFDKRFKSTKIMTKPRIYIRIMVLAQLATLLSIFFLTNTFTFLIHIQRHALNLTLLHM